MKVVMKYLCAAADAAIILINSGRYSVANTGNAAKDYSTLFNQSHLGGNPEIILWKRHLLGFNAHNGQRYRAIIRANIGVTKSLANSYHCTNEKPVAVSSLYQGDD